MSNGTLLIMQDSPNFGGHELMFLQLLPGLIEQGSFTRIVLRHPASNIAFARALDPFRSARFEAESWEYEKRRGEPYRAPFRRRYRRAVRRLIAAERPRAMLLLQGRIENALVPLLAAPRDLFVASYVPMAHRMVDIGRRSFPGDAIRRRYYRRPDCYIVPGHAIGAQLAAAGARAPVIVADNVVSPPPRPDQIEARQAIGLAPDARVALVLGRLDVRQKGLDTLAEALTRQADRLAGWTLLVVGDGEGAPLFERLAREAAPHLDVRRVGWTAEPHRYLAAADLLLMPSRWEGVPLAMLEADAYGVPVLGSRIDVFEEHLPANRRIDYATADLAAAFDSACGPSIPLHRAARSIEASRYTFARAFQPGDAHDDAPGPRPRHHSYAR